MGWIFFNDSERLRVKILGPWRGSFSIESSVGNPRAGELVSCVPRVSRTLQNWQSHWLPPFHWVLPQKEWADPRGRFCWALWDMEVFRPNSVLNYALLFHSNFLALVGLCQVVAIVDANCSFKKILKNHNIAICISVQIWERGMEKNFDMLIFLFCGDGKFNTYCLALSSYYVSVQFSIRTCQPMQFHCFMKTCVGTGNL